MYKSLKLFNFGLLLFKNIEMKRVIYLFLAFFLGFMAFIFYNQTSYTASTNENYTMPNGVAIKMAENAKIKYNKLLFSLAQNMYIEGNGHFTIPKGKKLGVHTLNGSVKANTETTFIVEAGEKNFTVSNYKGEIDVTSYDLEETILAGESVVTVKEKPNKTTFNKNAKPSWLN